MDLTRGYTAKDLDGFCARLFEIGAVKICTDPEQGFRLKIHESQPHARLSPIFINLRVESNPKPGPLVQMDVDTIAEFFHIYLHQHDVTFDAIVGVPRAGEPFAEALKVRLARAENTDYPVLRLSKLEEDGKRRVGKIVDAAGLPAGSKVLVIDDLITKAGSKYEAIDAVVAAGYKVADCLVFLDREQGGGTELETNRSVKLHRIMTLKGLLSALRSKKLIEEAAHRHILRYLEENS